ncbi:MAG: CopD family protein [Gammaproteobacteria bacterium]|nr:CopD family protein [Gammaproteobacteria bacterium]MDH5732075.1 CopD family protein [Gammaproteobacteria bacterium]
MLKTAFVLHVLTATIWVGGMFFAYMALRPVAAELLDPPLRLRLWRQVFARFFPWVWLAVLVLPLSGYAMAFGAYNGFAHTGVSINIMHGLGWVMIILFAYVFFIPYKKLALKIDHEMIPQAADALAQIRRIIGINLLLGLFIVALAASIRF